MFWLSLQSRVLFTRLFNLYKGLYFLPLSLSIYKLFSINQLPGLHIGMLKNIQNLVILFILKFTFCLTRCFLFRCRWYEYFFFKYLDTSKSICKKKFVDFYKFTISISILKFNHCILGATSMIENPPKLNVDTQCLVF